MTSTIDQVVPNFKVGHKYKTKGGVPIILISDLTDPAFDSVLKDKPECPLIGITLSGQMMAWRSDGTKPEGFDCRTGGNSDLVELEWTPPKDVA